MGWQVFGFVPPFGVGRPYGGLGRPRGSGGGHLVRVAIGIVVEAYAKLDVFARVGQAALDLDDGLLVGQHNLLLYGLGQLAVVLGETADEARLAATVEEGCVLYRLDPALAAQLHADVAYRYVDVAPYGGVERVERAFGEEGVGVVVEVFGVIVVVVNPFIYRHGLEGEVVLDGLLGNPLGYGPGGFGGFILGGIVFVAHCAYFFLTSW